MIRLIFRYTWSCSRLTNHSAPCFAPSDLHLLEPRDAVLWIGADKFLEVDQEYKVSLEVSAPGRLNSTAEQVVHVTSSEKLE